MGRIEKSIPLDHRLSSANLMIPLGDPQDGFFFPTLTLMIDSYMNVAFSAYTHLQRQP